MSVRPLTFFFIIFFSLTFISADLNIGETSTDANGVVIQIPQPTETIILNTTLVNGTKIDTNWPLNTTVLQNQSNGELGIVDSFFQNIFLQISNLFSATNNETWVDLGVKAGFNASGGGGGGTTSHWDINTTELQNQSEILGVNKTWLSSFVDKIVLAFNPFDQDLNTTNQPVFAGANFTDTLDMKTNNITNIGNLQSQRGSLITRGTDSVLSVSGSVFSGLDNAFVLYNNGTLTPGSRGFGFLQNSKILLSLQTGVPGGAGYWRNSMIIGTDQGSTNASFLNDGPSYMAALNITQRVDFNTSQSGSDVFVQDDIQIGGRIFTGDGARLEGDVDIFSKGFDTNIRDGALHVSQERNETLGVSNGNEFLTLDENFDDGELDPFYLADPITGQGIRQWMVLSSVNCAGDQCSRAQGSNAGADRIMEVNFTNANVSGMALTFTLTTIEGIGINYFNVSIGNATDSVELNSTTSAVTNELFNSTFPTSYNNQTKLSLRFTWSATTTLDEAYVDEIFLKGIADVDTNETLIRLDSNFKMGRGTGDGIQYFDGETTIMNITADRINLIGAVVEINVTEIQLNVTEDLFVGRNIAVGQNITVGNTLFSKDGIFTGNVSGEGFDASVQFNQQINNQSIVQLSGLELGSGPFSSSLIGSYLFVIDANDNALHVVDVTYPANPIILNVTDLGVAPNNVFAAGNNIYIVDSLTDQLIIYDVSNPSIPNLRGNLSIGGIPNNVYVSGTRAYIVDSGSLDLKVVDVSDADNPKLLSTTALGGNPIRVFVFRNFIYIINSGSDDLVIYDAMNPLSPELLGTVSLGNSPFRLHVENSFAYIVDNADNTLKIVNVSRPTAPTIAATTSLSANGVGVFAAGELVYTVSGGGVGTKEIAVFDVTTPSQPIRIAIKNIDVNYRDIFAAGTNIYTLDNTDDELKIFSQGGIDVSGGYIRTLQVDQLQVRGSGVFQNLIQAFGGITVGKGGIGSDGSGAFTDVITTSNITAGDSLFGKLADFFINQDGSQNVLSFNGTTLSFDNSSLLSYSDTNIVNNKTFLENQIASVNSTSNIQNLGFITSSQVNDSYGVLVGGNSWSGNQDWNGGWTGGGASVINGDVFVQTLYAYNITGLDVDRLRINGSIVSAVGFNNSFDVGNETHVWQNGFFGEDVFIEGQSVKLFNYNQSHWEGEQGGVIYYTGGNVGIGTASPGYLLEVADGTENAVNLSGVLYINDTSGFVGIGTASPGNLLDVRGAVNVTGIFYPATTVVMNNNEKLQWRQSNGILRDILFFDGDDDTKIQTRPGSQIELGDVNGDVVRITTGTGVVNINNTLFTDGSGNVGIGTTSPEGMLHIHDSTTGGNFPIIKISKGNVDAGNNYPQLIFENNFSVPFTVKFK